MVERARVQGDRFRANLETFLTLPYVGEVRGIGMLAAIDDPEVFALLLATAEAWLAGRGLDQVLGAGSRGATVARLRANDPPGKLEGDARS